MWYQRRRSEGAQVDKEACGTPHQNPPRGDGSPASPPRALPQEASANPSPQRVLRLRHRALRGRGRALQPPAPEAEPAALLLRRVRWLG